MSDIVSMQKVFNYLVGINDELSENKEKSNPSKQKSKHSQFLKPNQSRQKAKADLDERMSINSEANQKKIINKNRAIKRILQTSKEILQKTQKWEYEEETGQKKSYVTQFNIYLKQYNRLSQTIHEQEKKKRDRNNEDFEDEENKLENVYIYTVDQDFRQVVGIAIIKEKISKANIEMIMSAFKKVLVVLKNSQMQIYDGIEEENVSRNIKLFEITNVDYHTQPYIVTVLTITRDKSKRQEYLYMMFDSIQNQIKWDRAIYISFMHRKMKRKQKLFLIEYPQKEEVNDRQLNPRQPHKKQKKKYFSVEKQKSINKIFQNREAQVEKKKDSQNATVGLETDRIPPSDTLSFSMLRLNTDSISPVKTQNSKQAKQKSSKNTIDSKKTMFQGEKASSSLKPDTSFKVPKNEENDKKQNQQEMKPKNQQYQKYEDTGKKQSLTVEKKEDIIFDMKQVQSQKIDQQSQKKSLTVNLSTKRKIQLKKKYEQGQTITKSKLFFDKVKIFYFSADGIQYWDYNEKTKEKSQRKMIKISEIKEWRINEKEKLIQIKYGKGKEISFTESIEVLRDLSEWIEVNKKQPTQSHKNL